MPDAELPQLLPENIKELALPDPADAARGVEEAAVLRRNPALAETVRSLLRDLGHGNNDPAAEAIVSVLGEVGLSFAALHTLFTLPPANEQRFLSGWQRLRLPGMHERWCCRTSGGILTVREAAPGVWYAAANGKPLINKQGDVVTFPTADAAKAAGDFWSARDADNVNARLEAEYDLDFCWEEIECKKSRERVQVRGQAEAEAE
jgi:hypothetical protein